jgi:hypothetical protein
VGAIVPFLSASLHRRGAGLDLLAVCHDERNLLDRALDSRLARRDADTAADRAVDHEDRREDQEAIMKHPSGARQDPHGGRPRF